VDKELERYYNTYFDLFRSEGWKQFIGELGQNALGINSLEQTKDEADMYFRKGQLNVLNSVINLENMIESTYVEQTTDDQSI
jgi:hypothetical protein